MTTQKDLIQYVSCFTVGYNTEGTLVPVPILSFKVSENKFQRETPFEAAERRKCTLLLLDDVFDLHTWSKARLDGEWHTQDQIIYGDTIASIIDAVNEVRQYNEKRNNNPPL